MVVIVQAVGGLAMLFFGGTVLVRGASSLASRLGVSRLAIGLTVVAFGTSMPELTVSVDAAVSGAGDLSLGNVVGSNIANIALILGLSALVRVLTVQSKVVRWDAPLMVLTSLALVAVMANGQASRAEGLLLLLGLIAYTVFTFWEAGKESEEVQEEFSSGAAPEGRTGMLLSVLGVLVGLLLLLGGGHLFVAAAISLAAFLGVSQAVIGLTIVAVGTSLPEVATSVIASIRGQGDIAIGNVVGSNIFNVLGVLGLTSVVRPLNLGAITWLDLGAMVAAASLLAILLLIRPRLGRTEGGFLVGGFAVYTILLISA